MTKTPRAEDAVMGRCWWRNSTHYYRTGSGWTKKVFPSPSNRQWRKKIPSTITSLTRYFFFGGGEGSCAFKPNYRFFAQLLPICVHLKRIIQFDSDWKPEQTTALSGHSFIPLNIHLYNCSHILRSIIPSNSVCWLFLFSLMNATSYNLQLLGFVPWVWLIGCLSDWSICWTIILLLFMSIKIVYLA